MDQLDSLNQVAEFHRTFKHPIEKQPVIPAEERCRLRVALLREELQELEDAIAQNDLVEVADALCDIQYVLSGAVLEFGLGDRFRQLFDEVQRSNMSKTCSSEAEAEETADSEGTEEAEGTSQSLDRRGEEESCGEGAPENDERRCGAQ